VVVVVLGDELCAVTVESEGFGEDAEPLD